MAETVSVRELRQRLASYCERAHEGETIVVTRGGRVDCALGPARDVEVRSVADEVENR